MFGCVQSCAVILSTFDYSVTLNRCASGRKNTPPTESVIFFSSGNAKFFSITLIGGKFIINVCLRTQTESFIHTIQLNKPVNIENRFQTKFYNRPAPERISLFPDLELNALLFSFYRHTCHSGAGIICRIFLQFNVIQKYIKNVHCFMIDQDD